MNLRKQDSTDYPICFFMADSADHVTGKTSLDPTVTLSKNGGSFGAAGGSVSEIANGWYSLAANATDRNTLGELLVHASASGADPFDGRYVIVPWAPFDADNLGLSDVSTIKGKTDNLPESPAAAGSQMDLVEAPNAAAIAAIQDGLATSSALSAHDGKLDTVDANVDAIKAKTDDLTFTTPKKVDAAASTTVSEDDKNDIADKVWDETQSGHTSAGTFGKYLDRQISSIGAATGPGSLQVAITVNDSGGHPLDGAAVWISTDQAGDNVVAGTKYTDATGKVTFMLDGGTYYAWKQLAGYNFTNPEPFTVS